MRGSVVTGHSNSTDANLLHMEYNNSGNQFPFVWLTFPNDLRAREAYITAVTSHGYHRQHLRNNDCLRHTGTIQKISLISDFTITICIFLCFLERKSEETFLLSRRSSALKLHSDFDLAADRCSPFRRAVRSSRLACDAQKGKTTSACTGRTWDLCACRETHPD